METEASTKSKSNRVFAFIFSFVFGVLVSSFIFIPPLISLLIIFVGFAVLLAEKIYTNEAAREIIFISLVFVSFGLGSLRYAIKDFHEPVIPSSTGIVVSEPEDKENFKRFVMRADNGEKVLVSAPLYSTVQYGDKVEVTGKLEEPGMIEDFDYGKYLAKDDVYYTSSFAEVGILSSGHGNPIKSVLLKVKGSVVSKAREIWAEPYASLLTGLIVSGKESMPKSILEEFRRAGVIHIVVLSGFNITLIADFLRKLFQWIFIYAKLPAVPQAAAGASIAGIVLFVIMTGGEATVMRAAIMAITVIAAKLFGRKYSAPRALLLAGFIMLLENPKILVFDPSFQLSFLATLGLIYFMKPIDKRLGRVPTFWNMRENLAQTLATQFAVLPALIYMMGDVSLVSIPANLLILTAVPYTMFVGFLAIIAAFISSIIAWPLTFATHLLLSWILFVSHTLGNLSFATMSVPAVSIWVIVFVYLIFTLAVTFGNHWRNYFRRIANSNW